MENKQTAVEWLFEKLWDEPKDKFTWYALREKAIQMEKERIEISDEEITKQGFLHSYLNELPDENAISFIQGAKWYREQLKRK